MDTFILSDNSLNSHGFRLDMTKLQLKRFKSNPVMLYNHGEMVGKWDNIRVEDAKLMAEPSFMEDEGETESLKIKNRVEKGFLKGASLGLNILSVEQTEGESPLVTAEVYECSIVDIPSNANSIILYSKEGVKLEGEALKLALNPKSKTKPKKDTKMKLNAANILALSLSASADDNATNEAIALMVAKNVELQGIVDASQKQKITDLIKLGLTEGRFTADKKETFEKLAAQDFDLAKSTIEALPKKGKLSGKEQLGNREGSDDRSEWTFAKWAKEDTAGLLAIKKDDPERYKALQA
jgi:hypothetical protein